MGEWRSILYIITERERAAESGRQGIILVWSFTSIYFFPFISPLQRDVKGPVKFRQSSKPSQRSGSKPTNKTVSIPPPSLIWPLWILLNGSAFSVQRSFMCPSWFCCCENRRLNKCIIHRERHLTSPHLARLFPPPTQTHPHIKTQMDLHKNYLWPA